MWDGSDSSRPNLAPIIDHQNLEAHKALNAYFKIHITRMVTVAQNPFTPSSEILIDLGELVLTLFEKTVQSANLIYKGTRDGFKSAVFHSRCDQHKNTLSVIKDTNGNVFGGFADTAWKSVGGFQSSSNTFLFSVQNRSITKHPVLQHNQRWATYSSAANMMAFGNSHDLTIYEDCNRNTNSMSQFHITNAAYDSQDRSGLSSTTDFKVSELEVFEIVFGSEMVAAEDQDDQNSVASKDEVSFFKTLSKEVKDLQNAIHADIENLQIETESLRCELLFVANHLGLEVPDFYVDEEIPLHECIMQHIEAIWEALKVNQSVVKSSAVDACSIVTINAGGTVLAVNKATLQQAPSGSILANMASDVWGHDLDSDGNIIQDVNSELFRLILNHLRLKTLLSAFEVPPIVVYEEQKTALDNLLAFYMLTDTTKVTTIRHSDKVEGRKLW